jgi:hypothetical protein
MAETKAPKKATKKVDLKKLSQSTEVVNFKFAKDYRKKKKDQVVQVSLNVAEILEAKGLGKQSK